jgi:4'-phosphopantetheinyl transferase
VVPVPVEPDANGLSLWWLDLDAPASPPLPDCLSAAEQERAARFVADRDRMRYRAAHEGLRRLLGRHTGQPPERLQFVLGPYGKPALADPAACAFNLSHSHHLAVVVLAPHGEVGVDVELLGEPLPDAQALVEHHFTPAEQAEFQRTPPARRSLAFLLGWTRKEACLKAIGCGLHVEPSTVDAGLAAGSRRVPVLGPGGASRVRVQSFVDGARAVVSWAQVERAAG